MKRQGRKPCEKCGGLKEAGRARRYCNACRPEAQMEYDERKKIRVARYKYPRNQRKYALKWLYGITEQQYDAMFCEQGGCCAICGVAATQAVRRHSLYIDHDHSTNHIRGLLCIACNAGLGHIERSGWLEKALAYLDSTKKVQVA
jgi:hypothetical protein